ncbi:DUF4430 domain-containing protein [Cohnella endophytica]|uniref:DUF4430 domain-containing protein n=1 Tax=Cohnella endophytica TaxID=2419778 RepID=A0A494YDJ9_9BACL|nr:DUF4430 domain-containing protein [Cohnella endophytica]RKP58085.1 DUF4430 domain-containing protein [Cohnella endophytica]
MKITKNKAIAALVIVLALTLAFFWSGSDRHGGKSGISGTETPAVSESGSSPTATPESSPIATGDSGDVQPTESEATPVKKESDAVQAPSATSEQTKELPASPTKPSKPAESDKPAGQGDAKPPKEQEATKDKYQTDPVPEGKPKPVEWQDVTVDKKKPLKATLSVTCKTILDNLDQFNKDKLEVLPKDGVIFESQSVTFYEGESVFDVLLREMRGHKIHMEFEMTPIYNSNYIEGINNIYEFDCGELSGWMYKVNGWFPNYGASRYKLKDGDVVDWVYTCDLGRDIGGDQAASGGSK